MIDRNLRNRSALARRAVVALIVLALAGAVLVGFGRGMFANTMRVTAVVDDAGGSLTPGSDVKARGVIVGKVDSISGSAEGVRVALVLDGDEATRISRDVRARVLPATVFGTTFVDLVPEASGPTGLVAGQEIAQDTSSSTLELQDSLDSTNRVLSAVHPAELATTLSSIAGALRGRGTQIGETIETLEAYLARLEPHLPLVQEVLRLAAIDLRVLADTSPDLLAATDNGLTTTRTIVAKRKQLVTSLRDARALVVRADTFLKAEQQHIIDLLADAATVVSAMHDERTGLAGGFRAFVAFAREGSKAFSDGPWLASSTYIKSGGIRDYTAADCPRFGSAKGDNCGGGTASSSSSGSAAPSSSATDPDSGLLGRINGLLADLGGAP